jgi:hypothetical protein
MSDRILVSGQPVPADHSHTAINPATGMQRDYVVLSPEERAKGFVKPVRRSYVHTKGKCGGVETTMGISIAETYARNPRFYSGTFCVSCRAHFPLNEFNWDPDGEPMDPDLQEAWHIESNARLAREKEERRQRRIAELERELAELKGQAS